MDTGNFKQVAIDAAKEAGKVLLELSQNAIQYQMKNSRDIQAEADLQSEKIIIEKIKNAFPSHSILSEEAGEETNQTEYLWVIDPLDGTINYARGIEEYCISIALSHNDQIVLGLVYHPKLDRLFVAEKGKGAFLNDRRLEVSEEGDLVNCLAATDNTSHLDYRRQNMRLLAKVADEVRHVRILGSGALHMARLAQGQLDFYFKMHYNHWDSAAGTLIVREAGGIVTDIKGKPLNRHSSSILAANAAVHKRALQLLQD